MTQNVLHTHRQTDRRTQPFIVKDNTPREQIYKFWDYFQFVIPLTKNKHSRSTLSEHWRVIGLNACVLSITCQEIEYR